MSWSESCVDTMPNDGRIYFTQLLDGKDKRSENGSVRSKFIGSVSQDEYSQRLGVARQAQTDEGAAAAMLGTEVVNELLNEGEVASYAAYLRSGLLDPEALRELPDRTSVTAYESPKMWDPRVTAAATAAGQLTVAA